MWCAGQLAGAIRLVKFLADPQVSLFLSLSLSLSFSLSLGKFFGDRRRQTVYSDLCSV
jgi:hypothetical protein